MEVAFLGLTGAFFFLAILLKIAFNNIEFLEIKVEQLIEKRKKNVSNKKTKR